MSEVTDEAIAEAIDAGARLNWSEPRAVAARYDPSNATVVVSLRNGCVFTFPARLGQGLGDAADADLLEVEVQGHGYGLRWDRLDVDLAVPALLQGRFGSERHMRMLAGVEKRPAKQAASRSAGVKRAA